MSIRDQLKGRTKKSEIDLGTDEPVFIKSMSGLDRSIYMDMSKAIEKDDRANESARKNAVIVAMSLIDKDDVLIYTLDDIDEIVLLDSSDIDDIVGASMKINKLDQDSQEGQEKN